LTPQAEELYAVGRIVKAFGIRGDVIVLPMTDSPKRFQRIKRVFIGKEPVTVVEARIERATVQARGVKVKLDLAENRTEAEQMVGNLLFVQEQDRIRPAKGAYFVHDLIGLSVVDEKGGVVGVLKEVLRYPAHDVYVVDAHGRDVMIPAVKEFVRSINLEQQTMSVRLIEGMME